MKCKRIAICGLIGSGKSVVGAVVSSYGYTVLDSDKLSRSISSDRVLLNEVAKLLGDECVTEGKLNREAIRNKVFNDSVLLARYTALFTQGVAEEVMAVNEPLVFVELPSPEMLPVEWNCVINVVVGEQLRLTRAVKRDGTCDEDIKRISSRQNITFSCDFEVTNNGEIDSLREQIDKIVKIIAKA